MKHAEPLIIVDAAAKVPLCTEVFDPQAEVLLVGSPPFRCSHKEIGGGDKEHGEITYTFSPAPSAGEIVAALNLHHDQKVVIDCEGDRAGRYLAWMLYRYLLQQGHHAEKIQCLHIVAHTMEGIKRALNDVAALEPEAVPEFYIRSLFDLRLGAHLKRLIGCQAGPGNRPLSYALLTTLFLLADREMERTLSSSRKSWQLELQVGNDSGSVTAVLHKADEVKRGGLIHDPAVGKKLTKRLADATFVVERIQRSELRLEAPLPYTVAELVHDAGVHFGYAPAEALRILKKLWQGGAAQEDSAAFVSNPFVPREMTAGLVAPLVSEAQKLAGASGNASCCPPDIQEGMILPLNPGLDKGKAAEVLDAPSLNLYGLILDRSLAACAGDAVGETVFLELMADATSLHAHLNHITTPGYLSLLAEVPEADYLRPPPFMEVQEGAALSVQAVKPIAFTGGHAERYTCATLFADLADFAIRPEPFQILMLQGLLDNSYLTLGGDGSLIPGPNTHKVTQLLNRTFPKMSGVNLSAYIEQTVHEVLSGRKGVDFAIHQYDQTLMIQGKIQVKVKLPQKITGLKRRSSTIIKQAPRASAPEPKSVESGTVEVGRQESEIQEKNDELTTEDHEKHPAVPIVPTLDESSIAGASESTSESVPVGDDEQTALESAAPEECRDEGVKEGESVASNEASPEENPNFDESAFLPEDEDFPQDDVQDEMASDALAGAGDSPPVAGDVQQGETVGTEVKKDCQVCGRAMILKKDQFGKFWSCSGFPACRHTESFSHDVYQLQCPQCAENDIVAKRTPAGKTFYVCLGADCEFMAWSKPHPVRCQICDSPYLVEKKSARGVTHLCCPKAGCRYKQALPGENGQALLDDEQARQESDRPRKVRVVRKRKGAVASSGGTKKVRVVRRRK